MKPTTETRTVSSSDAPSAKFHLSMKFEDQQMLMNVLRRGIYTDNIMAVLREYGANAWDAHRMVGNTNPIEITLPNWDKQELRIRDFGPGLSHEDMFNLYTAYGDSRKRDTDKAVGMLGIGSKAGFAYSDTFTIISRHDGMKRTYSAMLDDDGGRLTMLDERSCTDTGLEIRIAVKSNDIRTFERKAQELYQHFDPRPTINTTLPMQPEHTALKSGQIRAKASEHTASEWVAVMGCVPYRVNLDQLDTGKINPALVNLSGQVKFEIGEVEIASNREELRYGTKTQEALIAKLNQLVDEYVIHALEALEKPGVSSWDKRLQVQVLEKLGLPLPEEYASLARTTVKVDTAPGTFTIVNHKSAITHISIGPNTKFFIDDTGNALVGYRLGEDHYVVRAAGGQDPAAVRTMLEAALLASKLDGTPIALLSSQYWAAPYVKPKKFVNPKHKARMFTLVVGSGTTGSECWETVTRVPEDTDVYVTIEGFKSDTLKRHYAEDYSIAKLCGVTLPAIYGYKHTALKPATDMKGTHYSTWRVEWRKSLVTPAVIARVQSFFWRNPTGERYFGWPLDGKLDRLVVEFGEEHALVQLIRKRHAAPASDEGKFMQLAELCGISYKTSEAGAALAALYKVYPLLKRNLSALWTGSDYDDDCRAEWIDYVKMVDARNAASAAEEIKP